MQISRDRRSFSEVSSMSRMASSSNSITSESIAAGSSLVPYAEDNTAATSKPKRRRENRYKNAPPAVISVSGPAFHHRQFFCLTWLRKARKDGLRKENFR